MTTSRTNDRLQIILDADRIAEAHALIRAAVNEGAYIEAMGIVASLATARMDFEFALRKLASAETTARIGA